MQTIFDALEESYGAFPIPDIGSLDDIEDEEAREELMDRFERLQEELQNLYNNVAQIGGFAQKYG